MKLSQTLNSKSIVACLIAATLIVGLSGCGKSEAEKKRDEDRQKVKEAIAAVSVRTKGSTYAEFRQSRLDFETCYEANKSSLTDLDDQLSTLSQIMSATDYCWNDSIKFAESPLPIPNDKEGEAAACIILPSISEKLNYTWDQRMHDRDFNPKNFVTRGLTKTQQQCDSLLSVFEKTK